MSIEDFNYHLGTIKLEISTAHKIGLERVKYFQKQNTWIFYDTQKKDNGKYRVFFKYEPIESEIPKKLKGSTK